jgi:hypothetical protein
MFFTLELTQADLLASGARQFEVRGFIPHFEGRGEAGAQEQTDADHTDQELTLQGEDVSSHADDSFLERDALWQCMTSLRTPNETPFDPYRFRMDPIVDGLAL